MSLHTFSPEANYLTRDNIVHPRSSNAAVVAADEARARTEISQRTGLTVSGGSIKKER